MNKKTLFIGGIKSGKSHNAQKHILQTTHTKPLYLATTEFVDTGMQERIDAHKKERGDAFVTQEEPLHIEEVIAKSEQPILLECISMWINNMLHHGYTYDAMLVKLHTIMALDKTIVFVLNDVGGGVIPDNALAREFVDISGKISQLLGSECDEVYHTIAGIATRIK